MGQRYTSLSRSYGACEADDRIEGTEEDDRLLYSEDGVEDSEDNIYNGNSYSSSSSDSEVQDGVRKMEAISKTWTQRSLIVAYLG